MSERFVFHPHTGINSLVEQFEQTRQGRDVAGRIESEFSSVADALQHTSAVGASSVIHLPDGNNIALVNISKGELARAEVRVADIDGFNIY